MRTSSFWGTTGSVIGSNGIVEMERCNSIRPRDMNKHIQWTSRTVGSPRITISTTCRKWLPFSVAFSASQSESSIAKRSLSIGRTPQPPEKSCRPVVIRLPPGAPGQMWSPNSWDPNTSLLERILMLWSKTSEQYLIIRKTQRTTWQYTIACGSKSSIIVLTWHLYRMNNCMQWSSVLSMVSRFMVRVKKLNAYLRCVDAQEARAGAEGTDRMTGCG